MKFIFDKTSSLCSKIVTRQYSTSFSHGIYFLDKKFHNPIYAIYGFVRLADEIVDSFHDYDKPKLMAQFRQDTVNALTDKISLNPILNSFQQAVNDYQIDWKLIDTFLKSMEMDLQTNLHDIKSFEQYILGSAEVVGLMCLHVFVENDNILYEKLKPLAMKLGAAFQKVNFLRDLKTDYEVLGRTYFPGINFDKFNETDKLKIKIDIESNFESALLGIKGLPKGAQKGVYLAYYYYLNLLKKINLTPAEKIMSCRIRINNGQKIILITKALIKLNMNWI